MQGLTRLITCSVTGVFLEPPAGLRPCDVVRIGTEGRLGLVLNQTRDAVEGTMFLSGESHVIAGTAQGARLDLNASWSPYDPGEPNPLAAALIRTINLNGTATGNSMLGELTILDSFAAGSRFSGAITIKYELTNVSRE